MAKYLTLFSAIHWKKRSTAKRRGKGRIRRRRRGDDLVAPCSSVLFSYSDLKKISFCSLTQGKAMAPEIPLDLQIEILKRLPSKSLMRFKCVSKLWFFLIRSRCFSNLYLTAAIPPRQPCLYMSLLEHDDCDSMEICQNPGKSRLLALSSSNSAESLEPFLTIQGMGGLKMVILRGLILYTVCRKACIYNPTTRQSVTLPAVKSIIFGQIESHDKYVYYFLGHDPVLDQYKVVCNVVTFPKEESDNFENLTSEHWVFVLEAGGCWKKIEFDQPPAHVSTSPGLCINGVIYYLACTRTALEIVMSFDVRSEEFSMIQAPQLGECKGFIEYDGKPTIFDHTYIRQNGLVDLWVLEDDGGNWSKKSLVLQASQMHLVEDDSIKELAMECRTQKGEIILVPRPCGSHSYFLYYDVQKNDLRKVNVSGRSGQEGFSPLCFSFRHMDQSENIMHLEI